MADSPYSERLSAKLGALPILPLRNSVLFPTSVVPINVGRPRSVRLVQDLLGQDRALVGVLSQHAPEVDEPTFDDLYRVGTIARVVKVIRLGASNYSVVLNGLGRMEIEETLALEPYMRAKVRRVEEQRDRSPEVERLGEKLRETTREVLSLMPNLPRETESILDHVRELPALADLIAANFPPSQATVADKQKVLETFTLPERLELVLGMVTPQLEALKVKKDKAASSARASKDQREEILRQQLLAIREALGESDEEDELELLRLRVLRAKPPQEVLDVARKQLSRLQRMAPQSAEYNVTRNYVEWIADLPWSHATSDRIQVGSVRRCLDEDHHGLEKAKKRIVEFTAVRQLRADMKGPILLLVGPPGVGKTSLGRSIARAMGRNYDRIALGGVRDEAEIRGHRRTYTGALPGRVIQALKRAKSNNPVLVLDEIEKMGSDVRGDPAAALLEVLDPEQNSTFRDHYMEVPFDLSQVLFIATANSLRGIPAPLLDRMEVIEVPGYIRDDKIAIARQYLVPKQQSAHGLTEEVIDFTDDGIAAIVDRYTREAGVRNLERQIGALCRATAVKLARGDDEVRDVVDADHVIEVLGPPLHRPEDAERDLRAGVATGLSSASSGGRLTFVEASRMPGQGKLVMTGNMRLVMKESAMAAVSYVRSKATDLQLDREWLKDIDLHLHIPHGGIPKDGTSAGLTIFAALVSLLLDVPLRGDVAVTGEISLRGKVLPVDDLAQKLLAAHRGGIRTVVIPKGNRNDLAEVPDHVTKDLDVRLIGSIPEVLPLVFAAPTADETRSSAPPAAVAPAAPGA